MSSKLQQKLVKRKPVDSEMIIERHVPKFKKN